MICWLWYCYANYKCHSFVHLLPCLLQNRSLPYSHSYIHFGTLHSARSPAALSVCSSPSLALSLSLVSKAPFSSTPLLSLLLPPPPSASSSRSVLLMPSPPLAPLTSLPLSLASPLWSSAFHPHNQLFSYHHQQQQQQQHHHHQNHYNYLQPLYHRRYYFNHNQECQPLVIIIVSTTVFLCKHLLWFSLHYFQ